MATEQAKQMMSTDKKMIIAGVALGAVSLGIMIASSISAAEIKKAESCTTYPKKAYTMSTGVALMSAGALLVGVSLAGYGIYKMKKGKTDAASFYRFDF